MQYEVKIYGDISQQRGEGLFSLTDLQEQLTGYNNENEVLVRIKTNGGEVDEGFSIYGELRRFAKENNAKIITRADGFVASIGTVIFLAGDKRILNENIRPFVHKAFGGAKEEEDYTNDLIAKFYAKNTLMTEEEAMQLMENETFIKPEEALKMKFGTEVEQIQRPAFMNRFKQENNTKQTNIMSDKNEQKNKTLFDKVMALIRGSEIKNKIIFDANNDEIDFYELEDDQPITAGAKANYKGSPAEGEVVSSDGNIYVFEAGVLKEIKSKVDEEAGAEKTALEAKITELENKLKEKDTTQAVLQAKFDKTQSELNKKNEVLNKIIKMESEYPIIDKKEPPLPKKDAAIDSESFKNNINNIKI